MSDPSTHEAESESGTTGTDDLESNSLMSQLRVIEDQPLDSRAGAFVQLHDRLQRRLEGGDSPASRG